MSERIFSGKSSEKFWDAVSKSKSDIIYDYGCKAQELESIKDDLLAALKMCERARACGQIEKIDKIILRAAIAKGKEEQK